MVLKYVNQINGSISRKWCIFFCSNVVLSFPKERLPYKAQSIHSSSDVCDEFITCYLKCDFQRNGVKRQG